MLKKVFKLEMIDYSYDIDINLFYELNTCYSIIKRYLKPMAHSELKNFKLNTLPEGHDLLMVVFEVCLNELLIYNTEYIKEQNKLFNYKISHNININEREVLYDALDELFGMLP